MSLNLPPQLRGHLAMLVFSALVAGSFSLGSLAANEIAPMALNALRFAIAAVVIGTVVLATGGFPRGSFRAPWRYLVLGALFAGYFVLMFQGLKTATPISTAAVFTLTPVITAGFGWVLLRQVTTPRMAAALAVGATGAMWVIFRADWAALQAFQIGKGELIYFWGCVAHALYTPMVRRLNRGESPFVFTFGMLVSGFLVLLVFGWSGIRTTGWTSLPSIVWIAVMYLAIVTSAVTFVLLQYATLQLPSAKVMAYTYLVPCWVMLWEMVLGHSAPPGLVLGGILLTGVALAMLLRDDDAPSRTGPVRPSKTARTHPD